MVHGATISLRILTEKNYCQIKLQRLQKVRIWTFGELVHEINSMEEVLKLKQNFQKNKVVTEKTPLFVIGPFALIILFVLTLASDMEVLRLHDAFSIFVLSTKKRYFIFFF